MKTQKEGLTVEKKFWIKPEIREIKKSIILGKGGTVKDSTTGNSKS